MSMKLVCDVIVGGQSVTKILTTVDSLNQGQLVKTKPGVGQPYMMFATLSGSLIMADFEGAPIVSADANVNNQAIQMMLADPEPWLARLTFA